MLCEADPKGNYFIEYDADGNPVSAQVSDADRVDVDELHDDDPPPPLAGGAPSRHSTTAQPAPPACPRQPHGGGPTPMPENTRKGRVLRVWAATNRMRPAGAKA